MWVHEEGEGRVGSLVERMEHQGVSVAAGTEKTGIAAKPVAQTKSVP